VKPEVIKVDVPARLVQSFMTSPVHNPIQRPSKEDVRVKNYANADVGVSNQINIFNVYNTS
jgi:hypothetical protein